MSRKGGGTGNILPFTTRSTSPRKCPTFDCALPLQCIKPWMSARGTASSTALTTGAYLTRSAQFVAQAGDNCATADGTLTSGWG